ncbi:unnamed protein product, partial [Hapterophycus canaliculatus]
GATQSKRLLSEACDLVGHGGPFPSPAEEQDVVLELGNLWYNRYCLLSDDQGVCFLADEALDEALRFYGESRELCVDLVAESGEGGGGGPTVGEFSAHLGEGGPAAVAAREAAAGCLLRAEFNVGMSLFEQEKHPEAEPHLAAAVSIFRELFAGKTRASESARAAVREAGGGGERGGKGWGGEGSTATGRGSRGREVGASAVAAWKTAVLAEEDLAGLGVVYASSLSLLGSCLLAAREPSPAPSAATAVAGREEALRRRAMETLEASVEAFLEIDDPARALDPLLKLVEALQLAANGEGDQRLLQMETLCDRVSSGLLPTEEESGGDDEFEDERLQLEQVRDGIADLRARCASGVRGDSSGHDSESRSGTTESRRREQQLQQGEKLGSTMQGGQRAPSSPTPKFRRVGPLPTAGFAQRRRLARAAAAAAASSSRNTAGAVGRKAASSSAATASSRNRYQGSGAALPASGGPGGGGTRRSGVDDEGHVGSVPHGVAGGSGGGVGGSAGCGRVGRREGEGSSFAGLRAAVALEDGMEALAAA